MSLKGKREKECVEMCNMLEIQSRWWKTLIALQSPLSEALHLTMPHLIWFWQLRVYLHHTEVPKKQKDPTFGFYNFIFTFLLLPNAKVIPPCFSFLLCSFSQGSNNDPLVFPDYWQETLIIFCEVQRFPNHPKYT